MTYFPPLVPDAAPLAITTREDALAQLPGWLKASDDRPITDALLDALLAIVLEAQYRGSYAAAQSQVARAAGRFLVELASERGAQASDGEQDETLRAHTLQVSKSVSLANVRAAVNTILAPYTDRQCQVIEPALDRWFVRAGGSTTGWPGGSVGVGISPAYTDRLYPSEASRNGGLSLESSEPKGARTFADGRLGRTFLVLVPSLPGAAALQSFAWGAPRPLSILPDPRTNGPAPFAGGSAAQVGFFVRSSGAPADAIMCSIAVAVASITGHSMQWMILSEPNL